MPPSLPVERMLGLQVCTATACDVASSLMQWTREPMHGRYFVCMNPHSFESARRLDAFRVAAEDADLLIPDGIGVVLASRLSGGSILERVCGPDVFRLLSQQLDAEKGKRVFFLGGRPDVLDRVVSRYRREYPGVDVAGAYSPPFSTSFSTSQNADMVALVNDHSPDILWVGLGSPKQEIWTRENANALKAKVIAPIGAAFDFYAGSIKPPPVWMQRSGLQWFHRLTQEPGRLWRRNLDSPLFLARVLWVNWFARLAGGSI